MQIESHRRVLANGLCVVVHEDHTAPIVAVYVYYHVGSSREVRGRTGFAHLFEHMLFQGSAHVPEGGHFELVQAAGGTLNGTTNQDRTNYFETLPAEHLELALFLESDRMGHLLPAMTQAKLDNQRDVVRNERRQSYENRPYGLVYETLLGALYPDDHPYSWPTIGSMEDIGAATLADVEAFFRRWYGPNNATLVIAGDVERGRAFELAERWFGGLPRGPEVATPAALPAGLAETRRLVLEDRVQLPQLTLTWPTVEAWHPDEPALNLLADVLSANQASILDRVLTVEEELASAVTIAHQTGERAGQLAVTLRPARDTALARLESRVDELLRDLVETGVDGDRLARLRNRMEGGLLRGLESVAARAALLGSDQCFRGEVDGLERRLAAHRAVTPEDVRSAAARYLVEAPRVVLSTVPEGERGLASEGPVSRRVARGDVERGQVPAAASERPLVLGAVRAQRRGALDVRVLADERLPLVHVDLVLPGGCGRERPEEAGRASLVAELLAEGTRRLDSRAFPDALDGLGATLTPTIGAEETAVRLVTLARTADEALALLEDVLLEPRLDPADVQRVVHRRALAIRTRHDRAKELADDAFRALVFGADDPRGRPRHGVESALEGFDPEAARALLARLTAEGDPLLASVGPLRPEELVERLPRLGARESGTARPATEDGVSEGGAGGTGLRIVLIDKPGAPQSEIRVGQLGIARDDPDFDRFLAVDHVLGGAFSSRINRNLREEKGWTYGARSSFDGGRARGSFVVATAVETGVTAPALEEILRELEHALEGFTADEARFASEALARSLRRSYASTGARLAYLRNLARYGFESDYPEQRLRALAELRPAEMDTVARRVLRPAEMAVVVVGDASRVRGELEALGRGTVQ